MQIGIEIVFINKFNKKVINKNRAILRSICIFFKYVIMVLYPYTKNYSDDAYISFAIHFSMHYVHIYICEIACPIMPCSHCTLQMC